MRIVYLTAGAAGMFCGSCLHDNALAKALIRRGHDTLLVPTYTPILTDEMSVSVNTLFYGGINVYLQHISPFFRWVPKWLDRWLDQPQLVRWLASRSMETSAENLGSLTVSMLKGENGRQRKEVRRLCDWLVSVKPDVIIFTNLLIAGSICELKSRIDCPMIVTLQGDDIFYDGLIEPYRSQAQVELRRLAASVDRFIVHSNYYADHMASLLGLTRERFSVLHLSIDTSDFVKSARPIRPVDKPPTIGYLARIAPEKGLHLLVDAFLELRKRPAFQQARLEIAGWLGESNRGYWQTQLKKLSDSGAGDSFTFHGTIDRAQKLRFLEQIDVLSVPTTYREPKGLFILESLAAGVPYVQPSHGAFPELHQRAQAGYLFAPESVPELTDRLAEVLSDATTLQQLGTIGRSYVIDQANTDREARELEAIIDSLITSP